MATDYSNLRETAIKSRQESSQAWLERYSRARDAFFQVVVEGASEKMQAAADSGNFRAKVYEFTKTRRGEEQSEENQQTLRYGQCEGDENGLHVETLIRPRGIPYRESLMAKLKEHFSPSSTEEGEGEGSSQTFGRVFFSRHPQDSRRGAIFVSWDRATEDQRGNRQRRSFRGRGRGGFRGGRRFDNRRPQGESSAPTSN